MAASIDRITLMESKVLELGKSQREKGYRGGAFTPGFIKSETEYSYRAINMILESLIEKGLVEKTITSAIRKGSVVELDVYKITQEGMECLDRVASGEVKVNGTEPPAARAPRPEPKPYSKPWDDAPRQSKPWDSRSADPETAQSIRALQEAVNIINRELKTLSEKVDRAMAQQPAAAPAPPAPQSRKLRPTDSNMLRHRILILEALRELEAGGSPVLADDLKQRYADKCSENDMAPKGMSQFTPFLKRLEGEGIISLKRVGCKNLGIKGQGSRVVVKITPGGTELLK